MPNTTNPEAWAAQERLRFVERSLYWRGWVKRRDLGEGFGISLAQASADLQRYFEMNPAAARYDTRAKRYLGERRMRCVLHEPRLEEAMAFFLPGGAEGWRPPLPSPGAVGAESARGAKAVRIGLPAREATPEIQRAVFLATLQGLRLRLRYGSLSGSGSDGSRWIAPHAFGHDGYRWHARAWCEKNDDYRDFVLSRIYEADWPEETAAPPGPDAEWESFETVRFVANPDLEEQKRRNVETDYAFEGEVLELRVRAAMKPYLYAHLRLPWKDEDHPPFLAPAEGGGTG